MTTLPGKNFKAVIQAFKELCEEDRLPIRVYEQCSLGGDETFDEFKATLRPMLESVINFDNGALIVGSESGGVIISKAAITYSTGANDAVTQIGIDLEMAVVELGTEYSYDIQFGAKYVSEGELADIGEATVVLGSEEYTVDEFLAQYSAEDFPLDPSEGGDIFDPPVENPDDSVEVLPDVA